MELRSPAYFLNRMMFKCELKLVSLTSVSPDQTTRTLRTAFGPFVAKNEVSKLVVVAFHPPLLVGSRPNTRGGGGGIQFSG